MHPALAGDLARLPELLRTAHDAAARAAAGWAKRPVAALGPAPARAPLPEQGEGGAGAPARFTERWAPGMSASAGPRRLGFVTGGVTPAALAGDWLTSAYDQNAAGDAGSWDTALERETVARPAGMFGLDDAHSGAFVTGATMSNTVGLAIAREWPGERLGLDVWRAGAAALGPVDVLSGSSPRGRLSRALSRAGPPGAAATPRGTRRARR
ncbi:hypothetical protein ABT215_19045 [Streptomyces sp900105755]|uniref:hypothetical protein n=1 Tax=Streptomyces sp. 900105755 TaxID=3154389 RepID=UPI00331F52BF